MITARPDSTTSASNGLEATLIPGSPPARRRIVAALLYCRGRLEDRLPNRLRSLVLLVLLLSLAAAAEGKPAKKKPAKAVPNPLTETQHACARCLRAHLDFLASDALRGRGSATPDETIAA